MANDVIMTEEEIAKAIKARKTAEQMKYIHAIVEPETCKRVLLCIDGDYWAGENEKTLYQAIKAGQPCIELEIITRYAELKGIKWSSIKVGSVTHYDHGDRDGHYIIEGYITLEPRYIVKDTNEKEIATFLRRREAEMFIEMMPNREYTLEAVYE